MVGVGVNVGRGVSLGSGVSVGVSVKAGGIVSVGTTSTTGPPPGMLQPANTNSRTKLDIRFFDLIFSPWIRQDHFQFTT
jgi:hypothetical protein